MFRIDRNSIGEQQTLFKTLQPRPIEELYQQAVVLNKQAAAKKTEETVQKHDTMQTDHGQEQKKIMTEAHEAARGEGARIIGDAQKQAVKAVGDAQSQAAGIVSDAEKQAAKIIKDAEARVSEIFDKATVYAEGLKDVARQEGLAEGQKEAEFQVMSQMNTQAQEFKALMHELDEQRDTIIKAAEEDTVALVLDIAKKIVHTELSESGEAYKSFIRNAITRMRSNGSMTLRLSVEEYDRYIASGLIDVASEYKDRNIKVISDPLLQKGSCVVESNGETIDASVDTQMKRVEKAFKKELE